LLVIVGHEMNDGDHGSWNECW